MKEYYRKNANRENSSNVDDSDDEEENENKWSGERKRDLVNVGLFKGKSGKGVYENDLTILDSKISYSHEDRQLGARAEFDSVKVNTKYSSVDIQASGPKLGVEMAIGANTGAIVCASFRT